jgi:hypothetical protein
MFDAMASPPVPARPDLLHLHAEWQSRLTRLRVHEQLLSDALLLHAKGEGPRPDGIMDEVVQMRADCAAAFKRLLDAVKD